MSKEKKPAALVVGGTAGLGFALAGRMAKVFDVTVTGRWDHSKLPGEARRPLPAGAVFAPLPISCDIAHSIPFLNELMKSDWDTVVYAAGAYQEGTISRFTDADIMLTNNLCLTVPEMLVARIVAVQGSLPQLVLISSTSAFTPRGREPLYSAGKAGLHMLAHCLKEDERIGSVLLAAPCGMDTDFYRHAERDTSQFACASDIAEKIHSFMRERITFSELRFRRTDAEPYFDMWQERRLHSNPPVPFRYPS